MRRLAFLLMPVMLPLVAQHEKKAEKPKHPILGDPGAIEAGRKLFAGGCAACHGGEGQGGRGPNLRERIYWHPVDEDTLYKVIQKGIPAGGMPAAQLSEDQTWQVVAFVRSLTAPAIETVVPGDPAAGEAVVLGQSRLRRVPQHPRQGREVGTRSHQRWLPPAPCRSFARISWTRMRRRDRLSVRERGAAQRRHARRRCAQPDQLFTRTPGRERRPASALHGRYQEITLGKGRRCQRIMRRG